MTEYCYWCRFYNGWRCEMWQTDAEPGDEACVQFDFDYNKIEGEDDE